MFNNGLNFINKHSKVLPMFNILKAMGFRVGSRKKKWALPTCHSKLFKNAFLYMSNVQKTFKIFENNLLL